MSGVYVSILPDADEEFRARIHANAERTIASVRPSDRPDGPDWTWTFQGPPEVLEAFFHLAWQALIAARVAFDGEHSSQADFTLSVPSPEAVAERILAAPAEFTDTEVRETFDVPPEGPEDRALEPCERGAD